ncbi:Putative metabolite transport protein YwtG [Galdieria sulphuraria]|nr:Putative metabolite transport protein YwtG [Galdieria sulphuraria]
MSNDKNAEVSQWCLVKMELKEEIKKETKVDELPEHGDSGPKSTRLLVFFEILASIGSIMMGMDQFVVSGASLYAQPDLHIDSNLWSWITSGPLFGAIAGTLIAIPHNALFGRRPTFIVSCILYDIGVFMSTFAQSYGVLLGGRLIFGRVDAAQKSWKRIRQDTIKGRMEFEEMVEKVQEERCNERSFFSVVKEVVCNRRTRAMFIFGGLLPFASLWSGSAAVGYYMSDLFKSLGLTNKKSIYMQLPVEFVNFLSVLPAFYILDRFGRRRVMLTLMPISVLALIMIGLSDISHSLTTRVVIFVLGFFIYYFSYNPSFGTLAWVVNGELFESHTRNLGMASCAFWIFGNAAISTYTFSRQIDAYGTIGAFGVFAAIVFVFWLIFLFVFVDTSKLSLEDVKERFEGGMRAIIRRNTREMIASIRSIGEKWGM